MWIECAAIAGIFLLMSVIFLRRRRIQWLWATLPLTLVPLAYFVTYAVVGIVLSNLLRMAGTGFQRIHRP